METQLLDEPTDIGLLQRAKVGDFAAFQQLVAKLQPRVYGLAYRILQQTQDAEDATQQTFLSLIEHIADFREESSVATWVEARAQQEAGLRCATHSLQPWQHKICIQECMTHDARCDARRRG